MLAQDSASMSQTSSLSSLLPQDSLPSLCAHSSATIRAHGAHDSMSLVFLAATAGSVVVALVILGLVPPRSLLLLVASFRPAVGLDMALLFAVVAFDVAFVLLPLLGLGGKSLVVGLLVNVLAEHAFVVVVTDVFDESGRVDTLARLVGVGGDCADAHLVT